MRFIETPDELDAFVAQFSSQDSIIIPVLSDTNAHPVANTLSLLYVHFVHGESFVLPFNHNEAINLSPEVLSRLVTSHQVYAPTSKTLDHFLRFSRPTIDLSGLEYFGTGDVTDEQKFYLSAQQSIYNHLYRHVNLNRAVPLMVLVGFCEKYIGHLTGILASHARLIDTEGFRFHNNIVLPACGFMEAGGIHVDEEAFAEKYGERSNRLCTDGIIYTQYNPYTLAGRVSSKFGGISFTSLNKHDGTREMFTSRFEKGVMVLIDFESFHLRLMAELTGFKLPAESLHEYFGKQYFNVDTLTPDQYDESKRKTFALLYGDQRATDIPFFQCVQQFITDMWSTAQGSGMFVSPTGRTVAMERMEDPSPAKLFNYVLQLREMEVGMQGIFDLIPIFAGKRSKVVLYTYDSILIDFDMTDGKQLITNIVEALEQGGAYPVRIYAGSSYQTVKNVTSRVKK